MFSEGFKAFLFRSEGAVREIFPFDGPQVLDEMLVFATPVDESAFGHAER